MTVIDTVTPSTFTPSTFELVAVDTYRDIHKGIRADLFAVTTAAGRVDPSDERGRAAVADHVAAVAQVLAEEHPYDCVLCAGDDRTDESMFVLNTPGLLSVKVGDGPTQARFRVADPALLRQFLVKALVQSRGDQQ